MPDRSLTVPMWNPYATEVPSITFAAEYALILFDSSSRDSLQNDHIRFRAHNTVTWVTFVFAEGGKVSRMLFFA